MKDRLPFESLFQDHFIKTTIQPTVDSASNSSSLLYPIMHHGRVDPPEFLEDVIRGELRLDNCLLVNFLIRPGMTVVAADLETEFLLQHRRVFHPPVMTDARFDQFPTRRTLDHPRGPSATKSQQSVVKRIRPLFRTTLVAFRYIHGSNDQQSPLKCNMRKTRPCTL